MRGKGWGGGGRLFEAGRLLTFSAFRVGAYSRWALIRGWALIRINTVFTSQYYTCQLFLGFHLVITRVSRNVPATSADFRRLSEDFRTLPKMFRRRLSTSEVILKTTILACFNFVRTQKSTPSESSFNAFLDWIFIIYHFLRNALSGL